MTQAAQAIGYRLRATTRAEPGQQNLGHCGVGRDELVDHPRASGHYDLLFLFEAWSASVNSQRALDSTCKGQWVLLHTVNLRRENLGQDTVPDYS